MQYWLVFLIVFNMFEISSLESFFNLYGYWIVFFGTIIDHSGIPLFIVFAGAISSSINSNIFYGFLVALLALEFCDISLFVIGQYLKKHYNNENKFLSDTVTRSFIKKILNSGSILCSQSKNIVLVFNKWLPGVGKYLPIFIAYKEGISLKNIFILLIGNIIYATSFFVIGHYIGMVFMKHSKISSLIITIILILIFLLFRNISNRINKKKI